MNKALLYEPRNEFGQFYNDWRVKRVEKLEQIFGVKWFKNKSILELGCGFGHIGLYLETLGANVTFSDARQSCLNEVKRKNPTANTILLNQETNWKLDKQYDLVIHFGIMYNLNNWQQDLLATLAHGKYIALETAVNKFGDDIEIKIKDYVYGSEKYGPVNKIGTLPSVSLIENNFNQYQYMMYDTSDINSEYPFVYDIPILKASGIKLKENAHIKTWDDKRVYGGRKLWVITR